jgi:hypothetical protein
LQAELSGSEWGQMMGTFDHDKKLSGFIEGGNL